MENKKINLEELIIKYCYICKDDSMNVRSSISDIKNLLEDFGEQLLKLAAENANIDKSQSLHVGSGNIYGICVDKQSIIDTNKQVIK